ncbi:MAG: hypothetical protein ACYCZM_14780 [Acidimicrobiales bacterium]
MLTALLVPATLGVAVHAASALTVPVPVPVLPIGPLLPPVPTPPNVPSDPTPQQLLSTVEGLAGQLVSTASGLPGDITAYPGSLNYAVQVVYQAPGGTTQTTTSYPATLGVPTLIAVGQTAPDLAVDLVIDPTSSHAVLDIVTLPGAPATLPVQVEAIFTQPSAAGTSQRTVFGYDALASTAPAQYQGTANVIRTQSTALNTVLSFSDSQPGSSLVVVAGTFEQATTGPTNAQTALLSYAPVPPTAALTLTAGPQAAFQVSSSTPQSVADFGATFVDGPVTIDTTFKALPTQLSLTYLPGAGDFSYSASAPVATITADDLNPSGVFGRATAAHLLLEQVPAKVDLTAVPSSTSGGTVTIDAHGSTIGLVQVDLTSGPADATTPGNNGVLYEDLPSKFVVFARIYNLQKVSVSQSGPNVNATLDTAPPTAAGVPLLVDIQQQPSGGSLSFTDVTLDNLVAQVTFSFSQSSSGVTNIGYSASAPTSSLAVDTNAGGLETKASMASPLPASFAICQSSSTNACQTNQQGGNGSFSMSTSQPTTVNLTRGTVLVQNMRVQTLDVALQTSSGQGCQGANGSLFFNTNGENLSGYATDANDPSGSGHFKVTLPTGFTSTNRLITYQVNEANLFGTCIPYSLTVHRTGQINCPAGTQFLVYAGSLLGWINITNGVDIYGINVAKGIC